MDIETITQQLGESYQTNKSSEKDLNRLRTDFFDAATEVLSNETLAQRTVGYTGQPEEYIDIHYPGWQIISFDEEQNTAIIEEDPAYKPYVYLSNDHKLIFQKNVVQASPSLDDDRLRTEDFDLWMRITKCPEEELLNSFVKESGGDIIPQLVKRFIDHHYVAFTRTLLPLEEVNEKDFEALQKYVIPGKLKYRLEPIRKPKPDELE